MNYSSSGLRKRILSSATMKSSPTTTAKEPGHIKDHGLSTDKDLPPTPMDSQEPQSIDEETASECGCIVGNSASNSDRVVRNGELLTTDGNLQGDRASTLQGNDKHNSGPGCNQTVGLSQRNGIHKDHVNTTKAPPRTTSNSSKYDDTATASYLASPHTTNNVFKVEAAEDKHRNKSPSLTRSSDKYKDDKISNSGHKRKVPPYLRGRPILERSINYRPILENDEEADIEFPVTEHSAFLENLGEEMHSDSTLLAVVGNGSLGMDEQATYKGGMKNDITGIGINGTTLNSNLMDEYDNTNKTTDDSSTCKSCEVNQISESDVEFKDVKPRKVSFKNTKPTTPYPHNLAWSFSHSSSIHSRSSMETSFDEPDDAVEVYFDDVNGAARKDNSKPRPNSLVETELLCTDGVDDIRKPLIDVPSMQRRPSDQAKKNFLAVIDEIEEMSSELDEETKWIRNHIRQRECVRFTPVIAKDGDKGSTNPECQCGHLKSSHSSSALRNMSPQDRWTKKTHTTQKMTNAFGEMEFVGYGGNIGNYSKFIRVDVDTKMSDMMHLMMNVWGMDKPNLLISVTGGAKNFQMHKRLKETFRRGLMKTALTTGAWIITGGTHAGVMKHVGEAVKDFGLASGSTNQVIAIGIAPWGCIQNREVLIEESCQGEWPACYRMEREQRSKESFLDPNHSHFILCDNGTEHKFAVEIPFRAKLENEIAKMRTDTGDNAVSVPIVLLVLEGGPGTLETVHQAIQNNTPAVIVKGSGRAADILAYAYQNAKEEDIEAQDQEGKKQKKTSRFMDDSLEVEIIEMVDKEFGGADTSVHIARIKDCLDRSDLMSVFELDNRAGSQDIDVAMLKALLKANKGQEMDQLRLALAWNRIDVAKSEIFTDDKRWPTGSLDDIMFSAIQLNRVDFVELFLDHGVSLREFLTKSRLLMLYNKIPQNCLLRTLLARIKAKEDPTRKNFSLLDVGLLIQLLMGDYYHPSYLTVDDYADLDVDHMIDGLTTRQAQQGGTRALQAVARMVTDPANANQHERLNKRMSNAVPQHDFESPTKELFIWSVLMNRQDMAKMFWADGKDAIAGALVANGLLKAMKCKTEDTELAIKMQAHIDEWSDLSIGVLSECYSTDDKKAQDLLVRELTQWGDATCMLIAVKADNKEFISQTACQQRLNRIWNGKMVLENSIFKILLCILFPPLTLWCIRFNFDDPDTDSGQQKQEVVLDNKAKQEDGKSPFKKQATFIRDNMPLSMMTTQSSRTSLRTVEDEAKFDELNPQFVKNIHNVWERFYYFFNAPVVIFLYNVISYIVFLLLFSYVLLIDFHPNVSSTEIMLMVWVFTIFTEEIRQVVSSTASTIGTKLQSYVTDTWNIVDMITIGLFVIGMVLRFLPYDTTFEAARVFLALNFVSFFLRLLHIFSVHKELGPKLVMIGRMVQDLMYFVVIMMVFVISYGIASHSILYPNERLTASMIIKVIRRPYWNIYGELFLDEIEGDPECTFDEALFSNGTYSRCPTDVGRYFVPIMMGVYMLLANVLLLNLLIAMFSYTFTMVQENTDKHWFYQRYSLIYEYYTRPVLCPPLIFFSHLYLLAKFLLGCCCCKTGASEADEDDDFRRKFTNERELVQWENVIADAFHHKKEMMAFESMEFKVNKTATRLDLLMGTVDQMQEHQHQLASVTSSPATPGTPSQALDVRSPISPSNVIVKMPPQLDLRLSALEKKMEVTFQSLEWIVQALQQNSLGASHPPPTIPNVSQEKQYEVERKKKKTAKEKEIVKMMLDRQVETHYRSRSSPYPGSMVARFPVSDDKVPWTVEFPEYSPNSYTSPEVICRPFWADIDLISLSPQGRCTTIVFNQMDNSDNCSRISSLGQYTVCNGLPLNPVGRTGMQGRGALGRWGPNHASDPVVTRWKMVEGHRETRHGKPVLEFVAVMRSDNQMWALPGAILTPGSKPAAHLKADFTKEALGNLAEGKETKSVKKKLKKLLKQSVKIYEGYADDQRNTDNAWLETSVYSYHDNDNSILSNFNLRAGGSVELATWRTASSDLTMHGAHSYFLSLVAEKLGADF